MHAKAEPEDSRPLPEAVAETLLRSRAVTLNIRRPYRYSSGITSPIYCDNRLLLSSPERRGIVISAFCRKISDISPPPQVITGVATAGIAWAAWIADRLDLPLSYVRGAAKDHGKGNRIEGDARPGTRAVVIEDLLSTGASAAETVTALRAAGINVAACLSIFSYQLPDCERMFQKIACPAAALTTFDILMTVAGRLRMLSPQEVDIARGWNRDPRGWEKTLSC